jgi:serpin B
VKRILLKVIVLCLSLPICAQEDYLPSTVTRNNAVSIDFFKTISNKNENIAISSFGLSNCMAMAYIGSEGKTQQTIADKMNFITPFGVLSSYKQLIKRYQVFKSNDVNLLFGNALWIGNKKEIQKKYRNLLKVNFGATVQNIDLNDDGEEGIKQVNRWVKKSSNFNILSLIRQEDIELSDELVFTNYLFFDGSWDNPFNEQLTNKDDFFMPDGSTRKVDFMNQTAYFKYNENNIFQILELPYAGKNISMVTIIPKKEEYIDSIENSLTSINYDFWSSELYTKLVYLSMPKFKIENSYIVSRFNNDKGLEILFDDKAQFPRISDNPIKISKIVQKTIIQAGENKNNDFTEISNPQNQNNKKDNSFIRCKANVPFIFIIKDNLNNNILLIGKVNNPSFINLSADFHN